MKIFPAIDLFDGKVVRLSRGDYSQMTVYSDDPASVAKRWETDGSEWLHVVDLAGAKSGSVKNRRSLQAIRQATKCKIQFGGGLRTVEEIITALDAGADRVIIGTKALDQKFLETILIQFGSKIVVSLDARDGLIQTQGWLHGQGAPLIEAVGILNQTPLATLIYTDIKRDGMMQGPNRSVLSDLLAVAKANVILAGGVSSLEDVRMCLENKQPNFEGLIIGKALFSNDFSLKEALNLVRDAGG
jgi:phosphoribosylformimino-5-aminoimidazole carboxamide ribotide isomerase